MLDPRVYRAAFAPAVLALIVAAFSVRDRPPAADHDAWRPTPSTRSRVERTLSDLRARFPERRPGSAGRPRPGRRGGRRPAGRSVHASGSGASTAETIDGDRGARRRGRRCARGSPSAGSWWWRTATPPPRPRPPSSRAPPRCWSWARVFAGRQLRRTLRPRLHQRRQRRRRRDPRVGAHRAQRRRGTRARGPRRGPPAPAVGGALERPRAARAARAPAHAWRPRSATRWAARPGRAHLPGQLARLAFPLTVGRAGRRRRARPARGAAGAPAASAARAPASARACGGCATSAAPRCGRSPRWTRRRGGRAQPEAVLVAHDKLLPGWAVRLVVGALILPVGLAVLDAFARARRRREPVVMWLGWVAASALPFALTAAFVVVLAAVGLIAEAPAPPDVQAVDGARAAAMAAAALALPARLAGRAAGIAARAGRARRAGAPRARRRRCRWWAAGR